MEILIGTLALACAALAAAGAITVVTLARRIPLAPTAPSSPATGENLAKTIESDLEALGEK